MASILLTQKDSITDEIDQLHRNIAERAYELFEGRGKAWGDPWADWLAAEQEVAAKPSIDMRENDGTLTVQAIVPGVDPKNIDVEITRQDLVIKGKTDHVHRKEDGHVLQCEIARHIFRSVHLPRPVNMAQARAEYRNGVLTVTAPIVSDGAAKQVNVNLA